MQPTKGSAGAVKDVKTSWSCWRRNEMSTRPLNIVAQQPFCRSGNRPSDGVRTMRIGMAIKEVLFGNTTV
jgi:hypothetical protein